MKKVLFILTSYFLLLTSIHAQSVDLLWQGDGYAPPFYLGRTLWSKQGGVTMVALAHGLGNAAALNYKWSRNGTVLGNISGVGKNTLFFSDSILSKSQTFKLEIISANEEVLASASVVLTPISPMLAVYENSPLYGFMFHQEVGNVFQFKEKEITFAAFPFFFSIADRADNTVEYAWRANVGEVETGNAVTYRAPDNVSGSSEVRVTISNKDKITQEAKKSFLVQFGEQ